MATDNFNDIGNRIEESIKTGDFSGVRDAIVETTTGAIKDATTIMAESLRNATTEAMKEYHKTTNGRKPYTTREETQAYAEMLQKRRAEHNEQVRQAEEVERQRRMAAAQAAERRRATLNAQRQNALNARTAKLVPAGMNPQILSRGTARIVFGVIGAIFSGYSLVISLVMAIASHGVGGLIVSSLCCAFFGTMIAMGVNEKKLIGRAKRYAVVCGEKMYAQISSLASSMGLKSSKVKKDLRVMLRKGYFPQGYLDDEETTLMLTDEIYKQYQQSKSYGMNSNTMNKGKLSDEIELPDTDAVNNLSEEQKDELRVMLKDGKAYIARLHGLNENIPGENITNKLYKLEDLLKEIFMRVLEHPEQMGRMHKLMDYYLPTMIKLVEAYAEYDKVSSPGEEILTAKADIETTLDTINEAFVQLLNNLFQDSIWDVTSDAQVLTAMLKQEGLASDMK